MMPKPKFKLGQPVFHICPESRCGIVVDARYSLRYGRWFYTVSLGFEEEVYCLEDELSTSKNFN